jgi:hypothetical protein
MSNAIEDGPVRRGDIGSLLSLAKYERAREDDYGQRMIINGLVLIVIVALITMGVLLVGNLHD